MLPTFYDSLFYAFRVLQVGHDTSLKTKSGQEKYEILRSSVKARCSAALLPPVGVAPGVAPLQRTFLRLALAHDHANPNRLSNTSGCVRFRDGQIAAWRVKANVLLGVAMTFIEDEFLVRDRIEASELKEWAKNAGIKERTLERARKKLGVVSRREGFGADGKYFLSLSRSDSIDRQG